MLNKSNNEIELCSKNFEIKNKWSKNGSDNLKKSNQAVSNKLNSILNRTLSDSILNKKSTSLSHTFQSHKRELCLSRKNSTNRRSILFHPCSTALNTSCNTGSPAPPSPSLLQVQSPNSNFFGQYNYRNKLKYHRSSWCIFNNNHTSGLNPNQTDSIIPVSANENSSFPCSLSSSLSPSPITILNNHASNSNLNNIKNNAKPLLSPKLQLTPASSNGPVSLSLSAKNLDTRRWSFASLNSNSSSGYGGANTPPIINTLAPNFPQTNQQTPSIPICSSSSNNLTDNSNPSSFSSNDKILLSKHKSFCERTSKEKNTNDGIQCPKRTSNIERRSRLSSSNESSHLDDSSDVGFSSPVSCFRQRARSLSFSPSKGLNESDMAPTEKFKEKFPKACKQLEENLQAFIDVNKIDLNSSTCSINTSDLTSLKNSKYYVTQPSCLDPAARFIQNQVIEIAKLCLEKSKSNQLTCSYLDEMTGSLEKLLLEAREKCCQVELSIEYLHKFIKKFLFIISHVARLLECIEFDPLEFSHFLDCAEQQAKQQEIKTDIPKYIISKLGIDRDPIKELNNDEDNIKTLNRTNSITSTTSTSGLSGDEMSSNDFLGSSIKIENQIVVAPCEDDFEEIKLISNGAYGAVFLVRHKTLGHRFAMKKIKKQNIILRNQIQQVFTERDIMTFTDNPFVVALICTFETKKHLCMVMEYVEGGDVATLIKNMGPLPLDMARTYFAETTLAVEYLHNYGIIHRDLKPDNLLITSLGHIKLTDFGLSKIGLMNLTTNFYEDDDFMRDLYCKEFNDKQICGTPQYLAPEVILRQSYGKTVDWWSMGVILYEFFTSIAPFNGNTPEELFSNVINGEICWPDEDDEIILITDDAKNLIISLLTHDPMKRLGANGAIEIKQHPFFNFLDWNNLLRIKAEFIPQLDGPDDTSYFDTRSERYNHESSNSNFTSNLSFSSVPNTEPVSKAESCLSLNTPNEDKVLTELLNKKLMLNEAEDNLKNDLNDDTDNELFASFSSCSSKFRLSTISNNSPILFNESNNQLEAESKNKEIVSKNLTKPLEIIKNSEQNTVNELNLNYSPEPKIQNEADSVNSRIKDSTSSSSSTSTTTTTKSVLDINKNSTSKEEFCLTSNSSSSLISAESKQNTEANCNNLATSPKTFPTTPTSTNKVINQQKKSTQQIWTKPNKNLGTSQNSRKTRNHHYNENKNNHYSNNTKLNRWPSSVTSNGILSTSPTINYTNNLSYNSHLNKSNQFLANPNYNKRNNFERMNSGSSSRLNIPSVSTHAHYLPYQNFNQFSQYQLLPPQYVENNPLNELIQQGLKNPKIYIKRSSRGFGFVIRAIKVFYGDSDFYTIQHLVVQIDHQGPAFSAGLKVNDIITHVNDEIACGKMHHEIVKLIMSSLNNTLCLNTTQLNQANIKTGGRKRSSSKTKFARNAHNNYNPSKLNRQFSHPKQSNFYYPNHMPNFNQQESPNYLNPPLSAYVLSSNSTNSSTSSLVSNSSRRSVGACSNEHNSYYNTNIQGNFHHPQNYQNSHLFQHGLPMQGFIAPGQPVQQERKKKACLFRKLSEKYANAHKHELQQQFQLQQIQAPQSSSSSSSSSSLNNTFNNNLRNACGNLSPKTHPVHFNNNNLLDSDLGNMTKRNMSATDLHLPNFYPYNMSNTNSPMSSFPNSPAHSQSPVNFVQPLINSLPINYNSFNPIQRNRPHSMIVLDNNRLDFEKEFSETWSQKGVALSQNVNTTRGSSCSNANSFLDEASFTDNDNTITAGCSGTGTNPSIVSGDRPNPLIFDPNHHFQTIKSPEQSDQKIEKSEPLFSEVVSKGLDKNEDTKAKSQMIKSSKPSLISSIKSSLISKANSNSKLNLSPFSTNKSSQSKNSQKLEKQQKKQEKQKPKEKQSQLHSPSPLATSDGLVITYGKLTSIQTSLIAPSTSQAKQNEESPVEPSSSSSLNSVVEK